MHPPTKMKNCYYLSYLLQIFFKNENIKKKKENTLKSPYPSLRPPFPEPPTILNLKCILSVNVYIILLHIYGSNDSL